MDIDAHMMEKSETYANAPKEVRDMFCEFMHDHGMECMWDDFIKSIAVITIVEIIKRGR
jgi:hypothetical protein